MVIQIIQFVQKERLLCLSAEAQCVTLAQPPAPLQSTTVVRGMSWSERKIRGHEERVERREGSSCLFGVDLLLQISQPFLYDIWVAWHPISYEGRPIRPTFLLGMNRLAQHCLGDLNFPAALYRKLTPSLS